ncbi:MAG: thiamine diphosphokinase [Clostridia bacterium]|nr:thiamine diphosphokinase [Clostridia bacterium]
MQKDDRCVIVGGAEINNYQYIRGMLQKDDFVICCDSGLRHTERLQIKPSLIVGDFDSYADPHLDTETITLPCEKDDTDTVYAVREAVRRGYRDFLLVGVAGGRLDHTLGNLSILLYLDSAGCRGRIIDDFSEMEIVSRDAAYITDEYSYFSLLNISGCAKGITVTGAKYPMNNGEIKCEYQYGISNEVLPGGRAEVRLCEGKLLLIKVFADA